MKAEVFEKILTDRLDKIRSVLSCKGKEYASETDRLHNFKKSADITGETPAEVCIGFFVKHLTSVLDIVAKESETATLPSSALLDEKIGDAINYLILLEAILLDY